MKHTHTLAAALAVAACGSTTGPHAPYMLIVYALAEKIKSGELSPVTGCRASPSWSRPTTSAPARPGGHKPS